MTIIIDTQNELNVMGLLKSAVRTSSVNGTGLDLQGYLGKTKVILDSAKASAGTNPTLDVKIQDSADNSTFADVTGLTFTQVTDSVDVLEAIAVDTRAVRRYIRAVATIGGTATPTFNSSVLAVGQKQVM